MLPMEFGTPAWSVQPTTSGTGLMRRLSQKFDNNVDADNSRRSFLCKSGNTRRQGIFDSPGFRRKSRHSPSRVPHCASETSVASMSSRARLSLERSAKSLSSASMASEQILSPSSENRKSVFVAHLRDRQQLRNIGLASRLELGFIWTRPPF
ncbi:hypothetical protein C8F04DRAFT_1119452 [Mycena alexandri]|uniref:Uncharacterized protein n=1 Tax=Mycena alexandri TaxID=1745969 RepID=A0AAD6SJC1_9AGAR|nr:hypothetical protein C8F04DRAFT_1119452 [Mycena alexandri]